MDRGLYIAASGMLAELVRQDQIASDLANASTPGYKPDRSAQASFGDVLLQNTATGQTIGTLGQGVAIAETATDLSQGPLRQTGEPLDLALQGDGFLVVRTPAGVAYTRNGQLATDAKGELVTAAGYPVLDTRNQPLVVGGDPQSVTVAADGTVAAGGKTVGSLAVVSLTGATKQGDNVFAGTAGARPKGTQVVQGSLEGSSVDAAQAMIDMVVSLRAFESAQKVIQTIDETLGRGIDSAGSVGGS